MSEERVRELSKILCKVWNNGNETAEGVTCDKTKMQLIPGIG